MFFFRLQTGETVGTIRVLGILLFVTIVGEMPLVQAGPTKFGQGTMLSYTGTRIGASGQGGYETWNLSISVVAFNQTVLVFRSNSTGGDSPVNSSVTVRYQGGFPRYADYLTALIYLPAQCISKSLEGNLSWTSQMQTVPSGTAMGETAEATNITVEAGSFRCINITWTLIGLDNGALSFLYDVDSGILAYEQWTPNYGDTITLTLTGIAGPAQSRQTLVAVALTVSTLALPLTLGGRAATATIRRKDGQRNGRRKMLRTDWLRLGIITAGAVLVVASIYLPWSQIAGSQVHLPLTLPSVFSELTSFDASASLTAASLMACASAISAWLSVAFSTYVKRKLVPQLFAIASAALAFASILSFIQTGLPAYFGQPFVTVGGILVLGGAASNVHGTEPKSNSSTRSGPQSDFFLLQRKDGQA
jgi:hypothetical protein